MYSKEVLCKRGWISIMFQMGQFVNLGGVCFNLQLMLDNHLEREWGVWFIYQGESYEGNVHLMTTLASPADLAYFWQFSPIASLSNYFLADGNRQKAYLVDNVHRRVNSIEYFAKGIEPKWEDPQNQKGGRFIFQVPRSQPNKKELYERISFFLMGGAFKFSERVNGFRFISSKNPAQFSYRIEIWVDFNEEETEPIIHFQQVLSALFKELAFEVKAIHFKQMKDEGRRNDKDRQERERQEREKGQKKEEK